ncbi:hybrid sensor histidine kinase/response regulator [Desulforegula conservatrix]|uniref:hybrid sensor histidine kinase/response regulator n=1 Tax=Desulforegula conservatrix TaxID=153026 RepID=UPI0004220507|nr:hybrid sensor histidine kinase/response regulator [Desulforegula conservatrix]
MKENIQTIFVADDNPTNLHLIAHFLHRGGFRIVTAKSGDETLLIVENEKPDLILLDVLMPGAMDGFETCVRLKNKRSTSNIPVIFMTSLTDMEDKVRGFQCGAVDYICKPIQQEELLARIQTHLMLQRQKNELIRLNSEKEMLFSVIAHDLKDPFNALFGYADLLMNYYDTYDDAQRRKYIGYIKEMSEKLYIMMEDLLGWARSLSSGVVWKSETIRLASLVEQATETMLVHAKNKGIDVEINVSDDAIISCDSNMISVVLRNLLSNAIKFTPPKGKIIITSVIGAEGVILMVEDNGVGIPDEKMTEIFSDKGCFSTPGTLNEKGAGLGLMLSREFLRLNGGSMRIESKEGYGSRFIVTFAKS